MASPLPTSLIFFINILLLVNYTLKYNRNFLAIPKTRTETNGDKSFFCAAPRLWNSRPDSVKLCSTVDDFKAKLKTHLFKIALINFNFIVKSIETCTMR